MKLTDHEKREIIRVVILPPPPFTKGGITSSEALVEAIVTASNYPPLEKGGIEGGFEEIWAYDYVFEYEWQSSRTKKDRSLELTSIFQEIMPGRRKIAVKVVDIFGNDTMTIVEVTV